MEEKIKDILRPLHFLDWLEKKLLKLLMDIIFSLLWKEIWKTYKIGITKEY